MKAFKIKRKGHNPEVLPASQSIWLNYNELGNWFMRIQTAMKPHTCNYCGGRIAPGQDYVWYHSPVNGNTDKRHFSCPQPPELELLERITDPGVNYSG